MRSVHCTPVHLVWSSPEIRLPPSVDLSLLSLGLKFIPSVRLPVLNENSTFKAIARVLPRLSLQGKEIIKTGLDFKLKALATPRHDNLTYSQRETLEWFRSSRDFLVLSSDKNLGLVVCDTVWYRRQMESHLLDHTTYEPTQAFDWHQTAALCNSVWPHDLTLRKLTLATSKDPCRFYVIPKVHKNPPASRPISGARRFVTSPLSRKLAEILQLVVSNHPTIVGDSLDVIRDYEAKASTFLPTDRVFAGDVTALYPSIDTKAALSLIPRNFINELPQAMRQPVLKGMRVVQTHMFVRDLDTNITYKQIQGTAMGTPMAPPYANLFLLALETPVFRDFPEVITHWRLIDDYCGVFRGSDARFEEFKRRMNAMQKGIVIVFTPLTKAVNFLDLTLFYDEKARQWAVKLFRKPINKYLYIPQHSAHTRACLRGWIKGELIRILRASGTCATWSQDVQFFEDCLLLRGYALRDLQRIFQGIKYGMRAAYLQRKPKETTGGGATYLNVRYAPTVETSHVNRLLHDELPNPHLRIAWSYPASLARLLVRTHPLQPVEATRHT